MKNIMCVILGHKYTVRKFGCTLCERCRRVQQ